MNEATGAWTEPIQRCGPAWRRRCNGLHVLGLAGSPYEMGRQHGVLLREAIPRGPLPYYRTYVEKMIGHTPLRPLSAPLATLIEVLVGRRVASALPEDARQVLEGLAEGAEIPYGKLLQGAVMPDSLMWLAARTMRLRRARPAVEHRMALGLGCSSAIAWGGATEDGRLLHARNFDYHGVEVWPRTAAVIFHRPDGGLRYVSITAAGVPMGGVTAMNEAGLTLTVHQHMFTDATRLGGTPIGIIGDRIMRSATTLDDAKTILSGNRPIGCWTYLIADGARRDMLCFEENPDRQAVIRPHEGDETFCYANIYLDAELGATERNLYGSYWRANMGRQQRLQQRLARAALPLAADDMASILGDTGGDGCRLRRPLAMLLTVGSVIFRPEDGVVWVASGDAPTSHRRFHAFSLPEEGPAGDVAPLDGGVPADSDAAEAFEHYRQAYVAYFDDDDLPRARTLVEQTRRLQPDQPLYHALGGMLALCDRDPKAGHAAFDRAVTLSHPDAERQASFYLWRGRAADLQHRRDDALTDYHLTLAGSADPPVAEAARRGLRRPYHPRAARRITVDFAFADVVAP